MHCLYCSHWNPEDEPRCQRCARRLQAASARPAPENYPGAYSTAATAAAIQPSAPVFEKPASDVVSAAIAAPHWTQVPRQKRLFPGEEGSKVLQFPSAPKPQEPKPRSRRQAAQQSDSQAFLDFLPPAPHAPRTLKTSVEAVIYCDAPVATPAHRAVGFALDFTMVVMAIAVFLLTFYFCGGEFAKIDLFMSLAFGGAFVSIAVFYGLLWVLTGSETAGQRWTGLRLINFDGSPIDRRERAIRFAAACLSLCSAGLGVLWSLADEESLTWHDHMSKTFPTIRV
jgi:uncharacterized RDD family membrane protein YckC